MPRLPARFAAVILCFAPLFRQRSWRHAEVLLIGAILAPGRRTVTSILRITGLCRERRFVNYHRVLNRAAWSGRAAARVLLGLLLDAFVPTGPVLLGLDDTIERRRGKRISAKGIYRDPVRSSHGHFVKASGLRWLSLMLLVPISWAGRVWALPFLTALAPSERYCRERGRRHKKLTDWGRQLVLQARRWMPGRRLVLVTDSGFSALEFLAALLRQEVTCVTRLRLDAALYRAGSAAPARHDRAAPDQGRAPADPGRGAGRQDHTMAAGHRARLVRRGRPRRGDLLGHRRLAPQRPAGRADPLGAAARSLPALRSAGPALHRPGAGAAADRPLVRPALAARSHLPRGARPPRRRDPASVVGQGHRPHHAMPARAVLDRHPAGVAPRRPCPAPGLVQRLVPQAAADLRRHASPQYDGQIWSEQGFVMSRQSVDAAKLPPALREGIAYALCHAA